MNITKKILTWLFWSAIMLPQTNLAVTPNFYFKHITIENGLSQNTVLSILQDKKGFMWFGTKDGLNRFDGKSFEIFKKNPAVSNSIGNNTIWSLYEDNKSQIWVGTDKGIYIYHTDNKKFTRFEVKSNTGIMIDVPVLEIRSDKLGNIWIIAERLYRYSPINNQLYDMYTPILKGNFYPQILSIIIDNDQNAWAGMNQYGIRKFNLHSKRAENIVNLSVNEKFSLTTFSKLISYKNNYLIAGTINNGLKIINKITGEINSFPYSNKETSQLFVRSLAMYSNNIWVGTESGLYIINPENGKTDHYTQDKNDRFSLTDNVIYSMYKDREGGIWIGTYFGGINYIPKQSDNFEKYYPIDDKNTISGYRVSGICEDNDGYIWVGTEDAGLNKFNPKTKLFEHFKPNSGINSISYHNVHDVIIDDNKLWVGLFNNGINVIDLKTKQVKHYQKSSQPNSLDNNDVFALQRDKSGNIWVGTTTGVLLFDKNNNHFLKQPQIGKHFVSDILEDSQGRMWFSTYDAGAIRFNPRTKECKHYTYNAQNEKSISSYKIISIFEDSKNRIWFTGETGGISLYNEKLNNFTQYSFKEGIISDVIYKILEDKQKNLWLSSNSGLIKFNPETKKVRIFNTGSGILSNQFNYKSGFKDKNGKMYFGGINGLIAFNPDSFEYNEYVPPVFITSFQILDDKNSFSKEILGNTKKVNLKYNEASFSINFAALSYSAPEKNRYAYKMSGLEDDWIYLDKPQKIIFSSLPYGKYRFQIKASNNDGIWNEKGDYIDIVIYPPFWKSKIAYLLYFILLVWLIYYVFSQNSRKIKNKSEKEKMLFEKEKEKEMYNSKIEFFTNIAHEVRTPLTLIKSPLEFILSNNLDKAELNSNLLVMEKNTNRLLTLINQLLDFRKAEAKSFSLVFVSTNINDLLYETYIRFKPIAIQKGIDFTIKVSEELIFADVNREALIKIVSNLFSNALKFAQSQIEVQVSKSEAKFFIRVNSNGEIIPNELKEQIFEPFFQINETDKSTIKSGSGIGLALAKSLVQLHSGSIYLDKTIEDINSFMLEMPIKHRNAIVMVQEPDLIEVPENNPIKNILFNKEHVLVVEDDPDLLSFVVEKLNKHYKVFSAKNGVEAIKILEKEIINLVISDVVMPLMNGMELCSKIKNEVNHSHIPVILLTAKATVQNKIEGLESGADAYIEKPFSIDFLYVQISNLLSNRRKIREAYVSSPFVNAGSIALTKSDETFLNKVNEIILNNISDPDFRLDQLADSLNMSRSSFFRKIKGVSEFSPNDFLKIVRLKRAAEILMENKYLVNEVCYLVGFSYPSYFAKSFQKQFGVLPKDFINK